MTREKGHLTQKAFEDLYQDKLPLDSKITVLEHLSDCTYCMEAYNNYIEQRELIQLPVYLKEEIISKSKSVDTRLIAYTKQTTKKMQFYFYSLRVGFAMLGALYFTFSGLFTNQPTLLNQSEFPIKYELFQDVPNYLKDFYENINRIPNSVSNPKHTDQQNKFNHNGGNNQ